MVVVYVLLAFVLGMVVGIFITGLLTAAKNDDRELERIYHGK